MIIIILTTKYGSTYYNTFTMGVCSNYYGFFFQCSMRPVLRSSKFFFQLSYCHNLPLVKTTPVYPIFIH